MPESPQGTEQNEKSISRRDVVKGGAATIAGALATLMAARRGSAAVTSMDGASLIRKKESGFTTNAVTSMD